MFVTIHSQGNGKKRQFVIVKPALVRKPMMTISSVSKPDSSSTQSKSPETIDEFRVTEEALNALDGKILVVKFGGNAAISEAALDALVEQTKLLTNNGARVVVVHGGGTAVNTALASAGIKTNKINGLRVTDKETLDIAVRTFAGLNENIAAKFKNSGGFALGFCSEETTPLICEKMQMTAEDGTPIDLGWVGDIKTVESKLLESWLWAGWVPVIAPIGTDERGHFYNINADHAALSVARALQADGLVFLTDVGGVLQDVSDPLSRIANLTPEGARVLIEQGIISGGMLPKILSCITALEEGVGKIAIINSFEPDSLLKALIAPEKYGTAIQAE
jgi:acetylglutamate kinase